ncbi:MAG: hypothetical protein WBQ50_06810 [Nocardioides sp.]
MTDLRRAVLALLGPALLVAAGCGLVSSSGTSGAGTTDEVAAADRGNGAQDDLYEAALDASEPEDEPLREDERFLEVAMPEAYTPSAPNDTGTDDYRCFVLDPEIDQDTFITGLDVDPGTRAVVHHVILFRAPPETLARAEQLDRAEPGQGWTCFGGPGLDSGFGLDSAPWLGAWAPGSGESMMAPDVGIPLEAGSEVVMQVHYNLLAGPRPDLTAAKLRLSDNQDLAALETVLLPAPVELPCRPGRSGELCDRDAAMTDLLARFGSSGNTANALHLLCGALPVGPVQHCDRTIDRPATLRGVAGHMHLLGKSIRIDVNPGTPRSRKVLDIPVWDFDDQGSIPVDAVKLRPGDTVRVTCEHDQGLRDVLPAFEGQPERYVVWGEGTTDEMCLGTLQVTRP